MSRRKMFILYFFHITWQVRYVQFDAIGLSSQLTPLQNAGNVIENMHFKYLDFIMHSLWL